MRRPCFATRGVTAHAHHAGKLRAIGVSNFRISDLEQRLARCEAALDAVKGV